MNVYDQPVYYDIAFGFRDFAYEAEQLRTAAERFASIPVSTILEVGCGQAPHLEALAQRGFHYHGLDLNGTMLDFARERAAALRLPAVFHQEDMTHFALGEQVDMAFVALGSIYAETAAAFYAHFDCMARALKPGGLYCLDWVVDFDPLCGTGEHWTETRDGITVHTTVLHTHKNRVEQTVEEQLILEVDDHGCQHSFVQRAMRRSVYPHEFLLFCQLRPEWEFAGWWNRWDFDEPIDGETPTQRPLTIIRRTAA